jgi:tetratricopeptide (TPR) repeat protein
MRKIVSLFVLTVVVFACNTKSNKLQEEQDKIGVLEQQMQSLDQLDTALAVDLINHYESYITLNPQDSVSPFFQKKIAELYRAYPDKTQQTVAAYEKLISSYRYHQEASKAILSLALLYEERGQKDMAAISYQRFIDNYPSHPLATQARQLLELLQQETVTDIQMVEEWMKNAKNSEK